MSLASARGTIRAASRQSRGVVVRLRALVEPWLLPTALVVLWHFAVLETWVPRTLIASPADVAVDLVRLAANGTLSAHIGASLSRLALGFGLGAAGGLLVGCWVGLSRAAERFLAPTISSLAPIPPTAWIPLLIILLGIEEASKIGLIAIGVFFVVASNTISGIRHVDSRLVEVARIYGKPRRDVLMHILLPAAAPAMLMGLRLGLGLSWILLIAAELITARRGIGWFIYDARNFARPDDMIAGMVCIGLLGMLSDSAMLLLQRRVLRWQSTYEGSEMVQAHDALKVLGAAQPADTAHQPALTVDVVDKSFVRDDYALNVLAKVKFHVEEGEVVAILGPSGSGKTTLLRMIAGLDPAFDGAIAMRGRPVVGSAAGRGLVFQDSRLLPWRQVQQNVAFSLPPGLNRKAGRKRVDDVLRLVGLGAFARAFPKELSGGMERRVALARALVGSPDLVLLDEPFGALDISTRLVLQDELGRLQADLRFAMVVITHDVEEAVFLADRIIILGGRPAAIVADFRSALPRPRTRTSPDFDGLRLRVLARLLNSEHRL